jgi:phosphatidylserine/phosphatidylglycerophosphate/cardiolipin synthase-like enzyme
VIEDEPLAKLFERYIEYDLAGSKQEAEEQQGLGFPKAAALRQWPDLFVPIDALVDPALRADQVRDPVAPKVFPSTPRKVRVKPVLTPDNYLDRVQEMIASAQRSVYIQFAYIKYSNAPRDQRFKQLLDMLGEISRRPDFNMKIILNSREAADQARRLVEDDGANFRDLKDFRSQGNIHNKGIVVDREKVLISSTNWSSAGALRNRDAGLIVEDAEIASFYEEVFLSDWYCRARPINEDPVAVVAIPGAPTPPGMARVSWQEYYGD